MGENLSGGFAFFVSLKDRGLAGRVNLQTISFWGSLGVLDS